MEKCIPDGDTYYRSCVRIIKMDPNTNTASTTVLRTKGVDYLYPALAFVNNGNAIEVFGAVSSSLNSPPSLFALGISPSGILGVPIKIKEGVNPAEECYLDDQGNERCRYGDYFGAAIDSDPNEKNSAYVTGQYMPLRNEWSTVMTKLTVQ